MITNTREKKGVDYRHWEVVLGPLTDVYHKWRD